MRGTIRCMQTACVTWGFVLVALVWGCKDPTAPPKNLTAPPPEITVSVVPADASLLAGGFLGSHLFEGRCCGRGCMNVSELKPRRNGLRPPGACLDPALV